MDDQDAYRAEITRLKQSNDELLSALQRVNKDTNCHFGITDLDEAWNLKKLKHAKDVGRLDMARLSRASLDLIIVARSVN